MKIKIKHPALRDLLEQLRFAPTRQQHKFAAAVEALMLIIDPDKDYPLEFVVYRITGYRPPAARYEDVTISGRDLLSDLRVWLSQAGGQLDTPAAAQPEPILTVPMLAEKFNVSEKTIRRWEARGLTGRLYVFEDGKKRKGYAQSVVRKFEHAHRDLIDKSSQFTKLTATEKRTLYQTACALAQSGDFRTRNELLTELCRRSGRARETLRYLLDEMERREPHKQPLPPARGRAGAKEAAAICKLSRQGVKMHELSRRFGKSRGSLYRILIQHRLKELAARRIDYIDSPDFTASDAAERLLSAPLPKSEHAPAMPTRQQETELFCRYNFLKYLAAKERLAMRSQRPSLRRIAQIESLLEQAEQVKQYILNVNTPLVVSIAGRHAVPEVSMNELVGEGTLSLMAAVEKFDYTRGYRFSTYAGWAIAKDFARKIPAESQRPDRAGGSDVENVPHDFRRAAQPDTVAVEQAQNNLIGVIESNLDERERFIILNHYALDTGVIKKKPMTLKQIGETLGITKERVRQIELQALHKLRRNLSPEQFDLLMR